MTDKVQLIRTEIEKKIKVLSPFIHQGSDTCGKVIRQLESLVSFIDSLPEEPVSEDFEKEMDNYIPTVFSKDMDSGEPRFTTWFRALRKTARHFADWQKQQMTRLAISAEIVADLDPHGADYGLQKLEIGHNELELLGIKNGTKVKIIVIKED